MLRNTTHEFVFWAQPWLSSYNPLEIHVETRLDMDGTGLYAYTVLQPEFYDLVLETFLKGGAAAH